MDGGFREEGLGRGRERVGLGGGRVKKEERESMGRRTGKQEGGRTGGD